MFIPENGESMFLRNIVNYLYDFMTQKTNINNIKMFLEVETEAD
jgi:hypothetical protein